MRLLGDTPASLAVTVEEFERAMPWIESDDFELTIEAFLQAAQEVVEVASNRPLTTRDVELEFPIVDGFCRWWLPVAPVSAVTSVIAIEPLGDDATIDNAEVSLQRGHDEPCLWFSDAALEIANVCAAKSVRVQATVGYDDGMAPTALKRAIILLVREWYDAGVSMGDLNETKVSFGVKALIKQQRYVRPGELG